MIVKESIIKVIVNKIILIEYPTFIDGGSSIKTHIGPLTQAMGRRIDKEEPIQKTLLPCTIKY